MPAQNDALTRVAQLFVADGVVRDVRPHGVGRIHDTFVVHVQSGERESQLLLQRINQHVFRDAPAVMSNVVRVTEHVRAKLLANHVSQPERRALQLVPARDGAWTVRDAADGAQYRAFVFIEHACSLPVTTTQAQARQVGAAFGAFQLWLEDFPAPALEVTIPGFHDTLQRLAKLREAARADVCARASSVRADIDSLETHAHLAGEFAAALDSGVLPTRIAHNDAKTDNVLFDEVTSEALCVVDLDTVMPGSWLHDFGDLARSVACVANEDDTDLSAVRADMPMLLALTDGYVREVGARLTPGEWTSLSRAPALLTLELAARFLTDHLEGDHYFKVQHPDQNLERARRQLAVLAELVRVAPALESFVQRMRGDSRG